MKTSSSCNESSHPINRDVSAQHYLIALFASALLILPQFPAAAEDYRIIHEFRTTNGMRPAALVLQGAMLYGSAYNGGASNRGTIFQLNTNGTDFRVLKRFGGAPGDGASPTSCLLLDADTIYGTTDEGGPSDKGTVFSVGIDGNNYRVLKAFAGGPDDGERPNFLVKGGTNLYGATYNGGISNAGTLFQLSADGTSYSILKNFTGGMPGTSNGDAAYPSGAIALSGRTLYGSTVGGGIAGDGVIFGFDLDSRVLKVLKEGNYADGCHFVGDLLLSGTTLYGTCYSLSPGIGGIFQLNTDGTGYQILKIFTGFDGVDPRRLILSGDNLYGTATCGAYYNNGAIYQVSLAKGTNYTLKEYLGPEGANPACLVRSGHALYGAAAFGGIHAGGVIYELGLPDPLFSSNPQPQTAELHSPVRLSASLVGARPWTCVWVRDETNVVAVTTNAVLHLANTDYANSGSYSVIASNIFGAATSAPAALHVIAPVPRHLVPALALSGTPGATLTVESAPNPIGPWSVLDQAVLISAMQWYFDVSPDLPLHRFYRAWQADTAEWPPSLSLYQAPALSLSATPGTSVQIDWINQFGPVDAWSHLATVLITNNPQLYFDPSAIGQPARLWRLSP